MAESSPYEYADGSHDWSVETVLVTGASGYIGSHVCLALLSRGANVVGTVRSVAKTEKTAHLTSMSTEFGGRLRLIEADLVKPESWSAEVVAGCTLVCHVASPFVVGVAEKSAEEALYKPARDGTTSVLSMVAAYNALQAERAPAAPAPAVRRVVVTSSMASVQGGRDWKEEGYGDRLDEPEKEWLNLEKCDSTYTKSKGIAERAAWDFVAELQESSSAPFELATILPTFVIGPPLSSGAATSHSVTRRFLRREMPAVPDLYFSTVDVRDVAAAHCAALVEPAAAGERFACWAQQTSFHDWAAAVGAVFKPLGYNVPTGKLPKWLLAVIGIFDTQARTVVSQSGVRQIEVSNAKARRVLGVVFTAEHESLIDHAHACIRHGVEGIPQTAQWKRGEAEGRWPRYAAAGSARAATSDARCADADAGAAVDAEAVPSEAVGEGEEAAVANSGDADDGAASSKNR